MSPNNPNFVPGLSPEYEKHMLELETLRNSFSTLKKENDLRDAANYVGTVVENEELERNIDTALGEAQESKPFSIYPEELARRVSEFEDKLDSTR